MKTPLCLVTGFLGSGKTTALKHLVSRLSDEKIVYLINEFSSIDIDGELILDEGVDVVSVPGGSIFCKCLVSEFIEKLREIPVNHPGVTGVVIEASGMADPRVVQKMLEETKLDEIYTLANILVIIDPGSYLKLKHTLPNVVGQVQAADRVVINKADLYDENTLKETETAVLEANPSALIVRTEQGKYDGEVFTPSTQTLSGEYALCRDPNYSTETIELDDDIDLETLKTVIAERAEDIYRIKGYASSAGNSYYVDYSKAGISIKQTSQTHTKTSLAVIYRGEPTPLPLHQHLKN